MVGINTHTRRKCDAYVHTGELYPRAHFPTPPERRATQDAFLRRLLADALGFTGCKMIRRVIGIAHVEDLEAIGDADVRARCERRALGMARELVVNAGGYGTVREVAALARRWWSGGE